MGLLNRLTYVTRVLANIDIGIFFAPAVSTSWTGELHSSRILDGGNRSGILWVGYAGRRAGSGRRARLV